MRVKALAFASCVVLSVTAAFAVTPATELFLASVGRGQGSCPGGVCAEWRTTVWITNNSGQTAQVEIAFLARNQANTSPPVVDVSLDAGESQQFTDIFADQFGLDGVYGALRLRSNVQIAAAARIYDANVQTSKGVGGAGQDFPGVPLQSSLVSGESTELAGLAQDPDGVWRSNFGMVETMGQSCTVKADVLDGSGNVLGSKTYDVQPFEALQPSITDIGAPLGTNQRVRLTVTAGSGAIVGFGSLIDNTTGDPTTVDQIHGGFFSPTNIVGTWNGTWNNVTFGTSGTVTVVITVDVPSRTAQINLTLTGSVFGGSAPAPETYTATYSPVGLSLDTPSAFAGTLTATINNGGVITGQATPPAGSPVAQVTFFGYLSQAKTMNLAYQVTLAAAAGGGQAGGFATLTKS